MQNTICNTLRLIEQEEHIRILHAIESGSRAWGFPSTDSDYDVRFIYVRPLEHYLKLVPERDVIERPISNELDIAGWDLPKTLQLLHRSNPTLLEWMASPIIYRKTPFAEQLTPLLQHYFDPHKSALHYLRMAERNYHAYLCKDSVRAKKYFYVLRPILACLWILEHNTPPPIPFNELVASQLPADMQPTVQHLLDLKINSPEIKEIRPLLHLNQYLANAIADLKTTLQRPTSTPSKHWEPLDKLLRDILLHPTS